jgi:hypothetical protein
MGITNYSDLQATIASYLARSDLTVQIPDFIRLAEVRLGRDLRIRQMLKSSVTNTTGGDDTVSLPPDFLQLRDLYVVTNPIRDLQYVTPSVFSRNGRVTESGLPVYYTVIANEFKFAPIPDTDYSLRALYYAAPEYLSDSNPSNVFLAYTPDLLLYGSLIEAEPFLMNDARIQLWAGMYDRGLSSLTAADDASENSGVPLRMTLTAR